MISSLKFILDSIVHETAESYQARGQGEQVRSTAQSINGKKIGCLKLFILSHFMFETCSNPQTQVMVADQTQYREWTVEPLTEVCVTTHVAL